MSRRLAQQFNCQPVAELTRQLLLAPPERRIDQVRRAEKLHDELDPNRNYPFDFVNFRITGYRSESSDSTLVAEALLPDLRLLMDILSRSVGMPRTQAEPILSPQQLAEDLGISTKTIERWRKLGLRWRWAEPKSGGRRQLVFTKTAVAAFLRQHPQRVERAKRFTKMDAGSRSALLDQARELAAQPGMSLYRAARQLARQWGRAVETVRLLLEQHDRKHAGDKIFADHTRPLTSRQKQVIERAGRMKVPVAKIAAHFRRSPATIHRVLREQRAAAIHRLEMAYVSSPVFKRDDAESVLLRPVPPLEAAGDRPVGLDKALEALPGPIGGLYDQPAWPDDRQRTLIVRMNYLKYKATQLRQHLDRQNPSVRIMSQVEACWQEARQLRHQLVGASLWQVLVIAHQHLGAVAPQSDHLIDLLEQGQRELLRAVDSYDVTQHHSFSSYVTWLLKRHYARSVGTGLTG